MQDIAARLRSPNRIACPPRGARRPVTARVGRGEGVGRGEAAAPSKGQRSGASDLDLLSRALENEDSAWSELLRRYRALLYRCITKAVARSGAALCEDDLDEIFGELCLNLWRDDKKKLRAYDPERGVRLSTWLGLLAINTAYDQLRKRARYPLLATEGDSGKEPCDGEPDPLEQLLKVEERAALHSLLWHLSDRDRHFVQLYYAEGMEAESIAQDMRISVKTVYTKKHKIEARLGRIAREERLGRIAREARAAA